MKTSSDYFITNDNVEWETMGEGVRRKILGYDPNLMMVYVEFKKGGVGYIHAHPHRQVTFVANGSFEVQIENNKKILKSGDSFIVPPDLKHGVVALEDGLLIDVFNPVREDFLKK